MKFDTTITLGNLVHVVSLVVTIIAAVFWMSNQFHSLDLRLTTLETTLQRMNDLEPRVNALERDVLLLKQ